MRGFLEIGMLGLGFFASLPGVFFTAVLPAAH
ncbi:hypothetical protein BDI4_490033 [Burkholderia diffusa]|nr:hypothetical protein BDI4_490033 [Burkholderia diffusa]